MTHIRGEIEKVYEIQKDAYTQSITGGRSITPYSFAFTIPPGTSYFNLASPPFSYHVHLLYSINISCQDVANIQRVYFIYYPTGIVLGDFYFYFRHIPRQFFLGNVPADFRTGYVRVYIENNAGGNRYFEGSVWLIGLT